MQLHNVDHWPLIIIYSKTVYLKESRDKTKGKAEEKKRKNLLKSNILKRSKTDRWQLKLSILRCDFFVFLQGIIISISYLANFPDGSCSKFMFEIIVKVSFRETRLEHALVLERRSRIYRDLGKTSLNRRGRIVDAAIDRSFGITRW